MMLSMFFLMAASSPPLAQKAAPWQMGSNTSLEMELPGGGIVSHSVSLPMLQPTFSPSTRNLSSAPLHFKSHRPPTMFRERHQNRTERAPPAHDLSGIVDKFPNVTKDMYENQRLVALTLVEQALELLRLALSSKP